MDAKLIQVGKKGVTPELLGEIKILLRKYKNVRVKLLKSSREESGREDLAKEITTSVKAKKSSLRGNILTLGSE